MANKYRLDSVSMTTDGSGNVKHDVWALDENDAVIPGRHQDVLIPDTDLEVVMAMPDSTPQERQAKNSAYKDLIAAHLPAGWTDEDLQEIVDGNDASSSVVTDITDYVTVTLGTNFPVTFNLG